MHKKLSPLQQFFTQFCLFLVALFVLLPIWGLFRLATDGALKAVPTEFRLFPKEFTLANFGKVWQTPSQSLSFLGLLKNSLLAAGGSALASVVLGATMAYAFARFNFWGRKPGLFALLIGTLLPPVALMTPLFILLSALKVRTTLFGLILVYTSFSMPFCVWNMRAAFQGVAKDLEEAAQLDGASHLQTFFKITLPLALPSISVAALVAFLAGYSEFAIGWLFVGSSKTVTLAMALWGILSYGSVPWSQVAALAILMSLPVVIIFIFLQRNLLDRLMIGNID
jgi:arabinogalactan oligomer/maltooligosaccharide transport system permease protein